MSRVPRRSNARHDHDSEHVPRRRQPQPPLQAPSGVGRLHGLGGDHQSVDDPLRSHLSVAAAAVRDLSAGGGLGLRPGEGDRTASVDRSPDERDQRHGCAPRRGSPAVGDRGASGQPGGVELPGGARERLRQVGTDSHPGHHLGGTWQGTIGVTGGTLRDPAILREACDAFWPKDPDELATTIPSIDPRFIRGSNSTTTAPTTSTAISPITSGSSICRS